MESTDITTLLQTVGDLQSTDISSVAAFTWLVYDCAITLDQEVDHIWRAKRSAPKYLYLFARYGGVLVLLLGTIVAWTRDMPLAFCQGWPYIQAFTSQFIAACMNVLLIMRLRALYGGNRLLYRSLLVLFIMELIVEIVITSLVTSSTIAIPRPVILPVNGCFAEASSTRYEIVSWIPACALAGLLFALTLYKLYPHINGGVGSTPLLSLFVRDGALFFGMIFGALLINAALPASTPSRPVLQEMGIPWLIAAFSVCASRLLLNLRGVVATPSYATAAYENGRDIEMPSRPHFRTEVTDSTNSMED